jgi:hypothetical protein
MSNVDALWLLAAVLIGGTFVTIYLVWMIFQKTDLIVSGIYEGTRVSAQYRNLVAREVAEERIQTMCYIGTAYALFGAGFSLLMSPYFLLHLARAVRAQQVPVEG